MKLTDKQKKTLLDLARHTITSKLDHEKIQIEKSSDPIFDVKTGAFVTLHKNNQLRGCIGYIKGYKDLHNTIIEMSLSAAFKDFRFSPLQKNELDSLEIEISVLSPLETISNIEKIQVGLHGIIIKNNSFQGLLLPQVAIEQKWDRMQFLKHTCLKAGLPENAYKSKATEIQIFTADIFSEKDY